MKERTDFKFEIVGTYGKISEKDSYSLELNRISWKNGVPTVDLRRWRNTDQGKRPLKGLTLSGDEIKALREVLASVEV